MVKVDPSKATKSKLISCFLEQETYTDCLVLVGSRVFL